MKTIAMILLLIASLVMTVNGATEEAVILTPPAPAAPRINGPRVYGARPGHPFLYRIPCTGERPIKFSVQSLPAGLVLDPQAGILTGTTPARGAYSMTLSAENVHGKVERAFKLVVGDKLALTPPMGWNHWYAHHGRITDAMMREAADIMVSSGMADVGYQYVNIDACWQCKPGSNDIMLNGPPRDAHGNLNPKKSFPNMKALTDHIHSRGLKAGIYSSPGPLDCAGYTGSYEHEAQDAEQFAAWGFDFLKYDWCSYGKVPRKKTDLAAMQKPYRLMGDLLKQQNRDIVFNLCQYGMGKVWKWGAEVGGQSWRTGGDLGFELNRIFEVALRNAKYREYSKPGEWNDPDYIQIGYIGSGGGLPEPCSLTPMEQYSFMSLWALMAAPIFYSGDMSKLDPFTLNVLCNPEVIEIDQDELGQCGRVIGGDQPTFIMVKDMVDGSKALGLFNRGLSPTRMQVAWKDIGVQGSQRVRDVWRQQDLGVFEKSFEASVPARGGVLIRAWTVKP